jgi:hypothetical protein
MAQPITLRVRHAGGTRRVHVDDASTFTVADVKKVLGDLDPTLADPDGVKTILLFKEGCAAAHELNDLWTLLDSGLENGSMLYTRMDEPPVFTVLASPDGNEDAKKRKRESEKDGSATCTLEGAAGAAATQQGKKKRSSAHSSTRSSNRGKGKQRAPAADAAPPAPPARIESACGGFTLSADLRTDGFCTPPAVYGELDDGVKTRRCWVSTFSC